MSTMSFSNPFSRPVFPLLLLPLFGLFAACGTPEIDVYSIPKEKADPVQLAGAGTEQAPAEGGSSLHWFPPEGWEEAPLSPMREASYRATGPDGREIDIGVSRFPGDAGGDLANVNRWRNQVGLPPIQPEALDQETHMLPLGGRECRVVSLQGVKEGEPHRVLGAIIHHDGEAWFIKLEGSVQGVQSQVENFIQFLGSLRFA